MLTRQVSRAPPPQRLCRTFGGECNNRHCLTPRSTPVTEIWWRPFRTIDDISVLHVDLTPDTGREESALACLNQEEQSRCSKYWHPAPRRRFALCRAALRSLVSSQLGCRNEQLAFEVNSYEKPFAVVQGAPAPISFNVSHSGNHGLIAFAPQGRLGVDIEQRVPRADMDGLIETVFGPDERADLAAAHSERKVHLFFSFWTMKEALIKALGMGLYTDISAFQVPSEMRCGETTGVFRFPGATTDLWHLENLGNEDFAAAIAYEASPDYHSLLD